MNNLELMRKRLEYQGGIKQEDRMIKDKFKSFEKALIYSYQGCDVRLAQKCSGELVDNATTYRALINPDKLKQDYDNKIISIQDGVLSLGDVFEWVNTNTHWLIYLEQSTEDAYFRGEIRLCKYSINFKDEDGIERKVWASIRGPVETQIDSIQKNQVRIDRPNLSLNILVPYNKYTKKLFNRYSEFIFDGKCWKVQAFDDISMTKMTENQKSGVLEVNAEEFFIDRDTDDMNKELKNGLVIAPIDPTPDSEIIGETFIKPKIAEFYEFADGGVWRAELHCGEKAPVSIELYKDSTQVKVTWLKSVHGQFDLICNYNGIDYRKTIVVETLF